MPDIIPVIIVAVLASLPGIYATYQNRRLRDADVASKITEAAAGLLDDMREQIIYLRNQAKEQGQQIAILNETAMKAINRIEILERENAELKQANRRLLRKLDELRCETIDDKEKNSER